jgi:integrase
MISLAEDYLAERRGLGFDLVVPGTQVMAFARFIDESGHIGPLTRRIVLEWVQGKACKATPLTWARRLDILRPFARYLRRLEPATEFPDPASFGRSHRRLAPHIYTEQEITDLLAAARRLPPSGTLRPATYEMIFGLIAATGLRLSETLHLLCSDVDLDQAFLTVRETKFRKSRHVPLHPTVVAALQRYLQVRAGYGNIGANVLLFLSSSGSRLPQRTVHSVFEKLRRELGWAARGAYDAPRIHDLRHTFICRRVQLWHDRGTDIDNAVAALSTYVGHVKVSDTYWYLTGVPELMAIAGQHFERFTAASGENRHG